MSGGQTEAGAGPAPTGVKRKRTPRVTSGQVDALLSILEARPYLHTRKFTGLQGRENFDEGWKEVAAELNQLPNGSTKTPEQWMTVWRDFKSRACSKAARLRKERVQTGNRAVTTAPLTEVERRIVSLIGMEYTFGTECPDAMPEEDMIISDIEAGISADEVISLPQKYFYYYLQMIISDIEAGISADEVISLPQTQYSELEFLEVDHVPVDTVTPSGSRTTVVMVSPPPPTEQQVQRPQSPAPQITASRTPQPAPTVQRERSTRNRNLNPRRSVDDQYSSARRDFLAVAESNAESMRMLAAAAKMQAEASIMFANAAATIGDAIKMQAEASLVAAKTNEKIAEALIKIAEKK